tara:strand:- start:3045 stop:3902 length:858 start_codon:yes stop_codon:yes gene_type:complete
MASKNQSKNMNSTNLFGFSIFAGIASIFLGTYFSNWILNIAIPIAIMLFYSWKINKDASDTLSIEQKADSVYYMGFILTLVAMTSSLVALAYDDALQFNAIVINFGLALATTILGLAIRIMWLQLSSQDLADAEANLKDKILKRAQELQDQTEKIVGTMTALSNQLNKVSEPLQANFSQLVTTMNISDGITTKLQQLEQSTHSAAQSLQIIASMAENLAKSSSDLNGAIDTEVIKNINNLNKSIINIQKNIQKTDKMVIEREETFKSHNQADGNFITNLFNFYRE